MSWILTEIAIFLGTVCCIILGYALKTRILKNRLEGIVETLIADIKEHNGIDWYDLDPCIEQTFRDKWSEIIKRGERGYYQWMEYKLGYKPAKIGDDS